MISQIHFYLAHELVHQFFGNAVLIDFWDHLWLIEGFTSLLEYPFAGKLFPDWRDRDFFNVIRLQLAFKDDESDTAPAMTEHAETIEEIERNFGIIAYDKAGSVLRMFEHILSPPVFQRCLQHYLKTNHRKVVTPTNLYQAFETILSEINFQGMNFTDAFQTWELQKGYPVIHVRYNKNMRQFHVTQKKFLIDSRLREDANSTWTIPLNFATSQGADFENTKFDIFFEKSTEEKIIQVEVEPEWFVFNKQQVGYYRVNYDLENWNNIIKLLNSENFNAIHVLNRAQLVDDALSFAQAGLIDQSLASSVLMYLKLETDYIPWEAATPHLNQLYDLFGGRNQEINVSGFGFVRKLCQSCSVNFKLLSLECPKHPD